MPTEMFEWLKDELARIQTPRFHVAEERITGAIKEAVGMSALRLADSYKSFVVEFGNVKLFRQSRCGYFIIVFAAPRRIELKDQTVAYHIGFHDGIAMLLKEGDETVYELVSNSLAPVGTNFDSWLLDCYDRTRSSFEREDWDRIVRGPDPFSYEEEKIVGARKQLEWRVTDVDSSGDRVFEVTNKGEIPLRLLTIGVRSLDRRLNGAVRLNVEGVMPGQTARVRSSAYKGIYKPDQLEFFPLPDPRPEDRPYYAEFSNDLTS